MVDEEGNFIGQVCHIEAAEPGGPRFNPDMTNEERRAASNLMLMCYPHHKITDNTEKYSVDDLKKMKAAHERRFSGPNRAMLERLAKLKWGALVGGGVIAGITIDEGVRRFESMFKSSVRSTGNKKLIFRDELAQGLRYAPSGTICWFSRGPLHNAVGGKFLEIFEAAGWQLERIKEPVKGRDFSDSMLLVFRIPEKEQVPNARQAIVEFFRRCGFSPECKVGYRGQRETLGSSSVAFSNEETEEDGNRIVFYISISARDK